jgi:long-chain acyl-CoA synthetase
MNTSTPGSIDLPASVADIVRSQAALHPDAPALTFVDPRDRPDGGAVLTYADLDRRSSQVANALAARGVGSGDRVAILAPNGPVFFEAAFGAGKIGAALVGLNWRLAAPEIETILADAAPAILILDAELEHLVTEAARSALGPEAILVNEAWDRAVADASTVDPLVATGPDDVAFILYTSGTTGEPKGAQLTNLNMAHSAWISGYAYGFSEQSTNLVAMPLFHVGGMGYGLSAFFHGGHTVLVRDADPQRLVDVMAAHRVTHIFLVPAVIQMVLALDGVDEADLSSLELLVYGASPISDAVLRRAIEVFGCQFLQAYGMTETAGTIVTLPADDHDPGGPRSGLLRSCGRPLPWVELRLVDPKSMASGSPTDAVVGEVGEIWTRSAQNTVGYRNKADATAEAITPDGWLRTGDAAYADADGYLYLYDRFKDMIVSGAENVYPAEVENVLADHPGVAEVAVIGVPDERWGETVKAVVVPRPGVAIDSAELIELSHSRLARYKAPTSVDFIDALPRNASGKVLKTALRAPFWADHDRGIS